MLNCVVLLLYSCYMYYVYSQFLIEEKEGKGEAGEREGKDTKVKEKQERGKEKEIKSEGEVRGEQGREGKEKEGEGEVEEGGERQREGKGKEGEGEAGEREGKDTKVKEKQKERGKEKEKKSEGEAGGEQGREGKGKEGEGEVEGERQREGKGKEGEGEVEKGERQGEGKGKEGEGEVEERETQGEGKEGEREVGGGERQGEGKGEEEVTESREEGEEKGGEKTEGHNKNTWERSCRGSEMSLVNDLLLDNDWHRNFDKGEVYCTELLPSSSEYVSIFNKISSTLTCDITCIERIENPFLLGCYLLKKQEYVAKGIVVEEIELFHCTSILNVLNIVRNNFDWRKTVRAKFGRGVSFSPFARYANKFANNSIGNRRAMIVAKVLIGDVANGGYSTKIPPLGYDTTSGNNDRVFVKFCDHEFYPKFVAYYSL